MWIVVLRDFKDQEYMEGRLSDTGNLLGQDTSKVEGWWDGLWHRESLEEEEEGRGEDVALL